VQRRVFRGEYSFDNSLLLYVVNSGNQEVLTGPIIFIPRIRYGCNINCTYMNFLCVYFYIYFHSLVVSLTNAKGASRKVYSDVRLLCIPIADGLLAKGVCIYEIIRVHCNDNVRLSLVCAERGTHGVWTSTT
jgi:hypothetical protein